MLTVHHLGVSQSDRIVWLCEELEVPYQLIRYERDPVTRLAPAAYKALHAFGTAPVITDGSLVLAESAAVIEYIINRHGGGRFQVAPSSADYAQYLYWFHFSNGSMLPSGMVDLVLQMAGADTASGTLSGLRVRGDLAFEMVEKRLGQAPYFAGDQFTAADIIMLFPLTTMRVFAPRDISGMPNLLAYLQRIGARPAYQRAVKKADPGFTAPLT